MPCGVYNCLKFHLLKQFCVCPALQYVLTYICIYLWVLYFYAEVSAFGITLKSCEKLLVDYRTYVIDL